MTKKNSMVVYSNNRFSVIIIILTITLSLLLLSCQRASAPDVLSLSSDYYSSESSKETSLHYSTSSVINSTEAQGSTRSVSLSTTKTGITSSHSAAPVTDSVFSEADQLYFKDCVFIGDSITTGIDLYGVTKSATVLADKGLNTSSAKLEIYKDDVRKIQPKYIYIMLGSNDIGHSGYLSADRFIGNYDKFVKELIKVSPGSKIYLQSVLPVTKNYERSHKSYKNEIIDSYNMRISQLAAENDVMYLNVNKVLKDENNDLRHNISPSEGMHITKQGYYIWLNYVLENSGVKAVTD
ncbi:MAG: GDSL-type esterase/lipase family protein [Eubacteriales bacterium]